MGDISIDAFLNEGLSHAVKDLLGENTSLKARVSELEAERDASEGRCKLMYAACQALTEKNRSMQAIVEAARAAVASPGALEMRALRTALEDWEKCDG